MLVHQLSYFLIQIQPLIGMTSYPISDLSHRVSGVLVRTSIGFCRYL